MNEIVAWGKRNYILGAGNDRSGPVDLEQSAPQCVKVCEDRLNPWIKVQTANKSVQSSGTILGEIISGHHQDRRVGNMAINCQTDEDAAKFARTRFMPRLKKIPTMACALPNKEGRGQYSITTTAIYYPDNTFLIIQGPGENNAQSFTADAVWNDEPYLYAPGRIAEFANRVGRRWNGKVLNTSVGAKAPKTDLDTLYQEGLQWEWNLRCLRPSCGKLFVPTWWKTRYGKFLVQWDRSMEDGENTNYARLGQTVVVVCPHCGERHPDQRKVRHALSKFGWADYVSAHPEGNKEKPSYRWNKFAVWDYGWAAHVEKFLKAMESKRAGDMAPMMEFVQKDMAETYDRRDHEAAGAGLTVPSSAYKLADCESSDFKSHFPLRFLGFDKQAGANERLEGACRAYGRMDGGGYRSRLVWTDTVADEAKGRIKQQELGVRDAMTYEDCAHRPEDVYDACRKYGWIAMYGSERDEWDWPEDMKNHTRTKRPYKLDWERGGVKRITWSNPRIKATVFAKRTQQGMTDSDGRPRVEPWEIPQDCPNAYLIQINQRPLIGANGELVWPEDAQDHRHDVECFLETGFQMYRDNLYPDAPKL